MAEVLKKHVATAKSIADSHKRDKAVKTRKDNKKRDAVLKDYTKRGLPMNFAKYLYTMHWVKPPPDVEGQSAIAPETQENEEDSEELGETYVSNVESTVGAEINLNKFNVFAPTCEGAGASLRRLPEAITEERIKTGKVSLAKHIQDSGFCSSLLRLVPRGGTSDTFEKNQWLPPCMLKEGFVPEGCRTFGCPWLFYNLPASFRLDSWHTPLPGTGRFLHVLSGTFLVLTWPLKAVAGRGSNIQDSFKFLSDLSYQAFDKFMDKHAQHYVLESSGSCWIPYGHQVAMVCHANSDVGLMMHVPILNVALASQCDTVDLVRQWSKAFVDVHIEANKDPWPSVGPVFFVVV